MLIVISDDLLPKVNDQIKLRLVNIDTWGGRMALTINPIHQIIAD